MRVAITGATGFLGGHLVTRLLADGHAVIALGRRPAELAALADRGAEVIAGDLTAGVTLPTAARADAMVHAAALSSTWGRREAFLAANVEGTGHALDLARRLRVGRFVHVSSPSIYFRFADQRDVAEDVSLPSPVNAYAASKRQAEAMVLDAADLHPLILRPRGIYGRGDVALLPRLVRAARRGPLPLLRGGEAVTDITHVDDVVSAILAALAAPAALSGIALNISGGEALRVRHIAERAGARAGVAVRWRPLPTGLALAAARLAELGCAALPGRPEPLATAYALGVFAYSQTLAISRAATLLGWRPSVTFEDGLARS
jgi:nucleoside-diphosphate-sugar epimerase